MRQSPVPLPPVGATVLVCALQMFSTVKIAVPLKVSQESTRTVWISACESTTYKDLADLEVRTNTNRVGEFVLNLAIH